VAQHLTDALTEEAGATITQALVAAGALDPVDGLVDRAWALGMMTEEPVYVRRLRRQGVDAATCRRLAALIQHHPTPAAGG
jgi:hypothetical protein